MRRPCVIIASVLAVCAAVGGASTATAAEFGRTDSAYTAHEDRLEVGLFSPLRYGVTEDVEISAHPLWMFALPNARLKVGWATQGDWELATAHGVSYPTLLLRLMARQGAGGVLPANSRVPHIISSKHTVYATRPIADYHHLSFDFGLQLAARFGASRMPTIDLPVVYPRTAAYHTAAVARAGVGLDGFFGGGIGYAVDFDVFAYPGLDGGGAVEHSAMLIWKPSDTIRLMGGYLVSWGGFAFGTDGRAFPLFDVQWAWNL